MEAGSDYEVLEELGRGCMGVVHRARQRGLEREVALKRLSLPPDAEASAEFLSRFRREAHAMSRVSHLNLVKVFDCGDLEAIPYIAMELVRGQSLEAFGTADPVAMRRRAEDLFGQLVSAVAELHRNGLVHRDLKPSNVMIEEGGRIVVMDLGLVKDTTGDGTHLTGTGTVIGTPLYTAPEVFRGLPADARADVWSLGCVYYFLHTGSTPWGGDTLAALIQSILFGPLPDLGSALPELPPARRELLACMLNRDPAGRPRDAGRVLGVLEGRARIGSRSHPVSRPRSKAPAGRWLARAFGMAVLLAAVAALGRALWKPSSGERALRGQESASKASESPRRSPAAVRIRSPGERPAPDAAPRSDEPGESPTVQVRALHGYAGRLKAGGATAAKAVLELNQRTGLKLRESVWIFWLELDQWLISPSRAPDPPAHRLRGLEEFFSVAPDIEVKFTEELLRRYPAITIPVAHAGVLELLSRCPGESRPWLLLGLIYEKHGLMGEARVLYALGRSRLTDTGRARWSQFSREALLHALIETGADLEVAFPSIMGSFRSQLDEAEMRETWCGVMETLRARDPVICERVLNAGMRDPISRRSAVFAMNLFLEWQGRTLAERLALLRAQPPSREVDDLLIAAQLGAGDLAAARPLIEKGPPDHVQRAALALLETAPGQIPRRPAGSLSEKSHLARIWMTCLAEAGAGRELEEVVGELGPAWFRERLLPAGINLLRMGREPSWLVPECQALLAKSVTPSGGWPMIWSELAWPGRSPAVRHRQHALLETLIQSHPEAVEIRVVQALLASREGRHDASLDLLENALAYPAATLRAPRVLVIEVLARPLWLAPGSPAAGVARTIAVPPARPADARGVRQDEYWRCCLAGDRSGAREIAKALWFDSHDVVFALTPLWTLPAGSPERETWSRTVRAGWRYANVNASVLDP